MTGTDHAARVGKAIAGIGVPFFLARYTGPGNPVVALHTAEASSARALSRQATAALRADGLDNTCRVVVHRPRALARFRSLEALTRRFGSGPILYDPTQFVGRSEAVVALGRALRKALPGKVDRLFFDASRRTIFLILDRSAYAADLEQQARECAETMATAADVIGAWRNTSPTSFEISTRIGFEPPQGMTLVSVDSATVKSTFRSLLRRGLTRTAIGAGAASLLGLTAAIPAAAKGPAVSEPNVSAILAGKLFDANHFGQPSPWGGAGLKGTIPLGESFGFQADAAIGTFGYWGLGGHVFWRDPEHGLIGAFTSFERNNNSTMNRFGGEAEVYLGNATIRGTAGQQTGTETGFFGNLDVIFYTSPNFALKGGILRDPTQTFGHAGFEWQPAFSALPGMSVFVDGQFGVADRTQLMAGLTYHFGGVGKTLIDRDRRDDPFFSLLHLPLKPPAQAAYTPLPDPT